MDWGFVLVVMAVYIGLGIALSWQDRVYRFRSFVWTGMLLGIVAALTLRVTENNRRRTLPAASLGGAPCASP